jgi:cytochrome c oxidase cbb3-type subunit III
MPAARPRTLLVALAAALAALAGTGCQRVLNGPATDDAARIRPDQIHDFNLLYTRNCAGCHGPNGMNGPAIPIGNPEYLAMVSDDQLRKYTAEGEEGTQMPGFGHQVGGLLTDEQIAIIVKGIRAWGKPMPAGFNPPPYAASGPGDAAHGAQVYAQACASCHGSGAPGAPEGKAGSVTNPTFLALLNDQSLRTIILAGRPDLGQPDWAHDIPGHPLSDSEITDVVAWIGSHRAPVPGQTHPDAAPGASELQRRVQ